MMHSFIDGIFQPEIMEIFNLIHKIPAVSAGPDIALRQQLAVGKLCRASGNLKIGGKRPGRWKPFIRCQRPVPDLSPDIFINLSVERSIAVRLQMNIQFLSHGYLLTL